MHSLRNSILSILAVLTAPALYAHDVATGSRTNGNIAVTSDQNWTELRSVDVAFNDNQTHTCVVTAAADFDFTGVAGDVNRYRFTVTEGDSNPTTNQGQERALEMADNSGVDDPNTKPVATTAHFAGLTNDNGNNGTSVHTFRTLARKENASTNTTDVADVSMSVVCTDND